MYYSLDCQLEVDNVNKMPGYSTEISISPGKSFCFYFITEYKNTLICCYFKTLKKDINLTILCFKNEKWIEIKQKCNYNYSKDYINYNFIAEKKGIYKFDWSNPSKWIQSRKLYYQIVSFYPLEIVNEDKASSFISEDNQLYLSNSIMKIHISEKEFTHIIPFMILVTSSKIYIKSLNEDKNIITLENSSNFASCFESYLKVK